MVSNFGKGGIFVLLCIHCGKTAETGTYCHYCGGILRDKIVNFETTGTLLRSNVNWNYVRPLFPENDDGVDIFSTTERAVQADLTRKNQE